MSGRFGTHEEENTIEWKKKSTTTNFNFIFVPN